MEAKTKKIAKILGGIMAIVILLIIVVMISMSSSESDNSAEDYVGKTFSGTSPWNTEVSILISKYEDSPKTIYYTYTEQFMDGSRIKFTNRNTLLENDKFKPDFGGTNVTDDYLLEYSYSTTVELKNRALVLVYNEGYNTEVVGKITTTVNVEDYTEIERTITLNN